MAKKVSEMTRTEALGKMWELAHIIEKFGYNADVEQAIRNIAEEWNDSIGYYAHHEICLYDLDEDYYADTIDLSFEPESEGKKFNGMMIEDEAFRWEI